MTVDISVSPTHAAASPKRLGRGASLIGVAVFVALAAGGALRLWANARATHALESRTTASMQRTVAVIHARNQVGKRDLNLPATLRGYEESVLYARTSGYLSAWRKAIGERVREGDLLATIAAPEQEHELTQARATREQLRARASLADASLRRWETQRELNVISQQTIEEKRSEFEQARADVAAADANVRRLEQMLAFQRILAPFDGVVTRRSVDVGTLVTAGVTELFAVSQTDRLRLTVWVPQAYANGVAPGQNTSITVNELANRHFDGTIEHVSGAIDPATRARQVDIVVPNQDHALLPGAYASVNLNVVTNVKALLIPPNAMVVGKEGPRVLLVKDGNRLAYRSVELGHDLGKDIEIVGGVTLEDTLVINPSELLQEGDVVSIAASDSNSD